MPYDLEPETPPDESPPKETPPVEDPNKKAIEEANARIAAAEAAAKEANERNEQLFNAYNQVVVAGSQAQTQPQPQPQPTVLPDPEEDPDGYMTAKIQKGIEEGLQTHVAPLVQQQGGYNQLAVQNAIELQRSTLRNDPTFPGYADNEAEINEYAKHFQPDELARPDALKECYYRVMGRVAARQAQESAVRDSAPEGGGRQSGAGEHLPSADDGATDAEKRAARRAGMTVKQFKSMQGAGSVTLADYQATVESK